MKNDVIPMEVCSMKTLSEYRATIGALMGGKQIPAAERFFISPRFLTSILIGQHKPEQGEEVKLIDSSALLARALENSGTVPDVVLNAATPEKDLSLPGVYSLLTETRMVVVWRPGPGAPELEGVEGQTYAVEVEFSTSDYFNRPPYTPGDMGRLAIGFINQNGAPPANPLSGIYKISHYDGKWIEPRIIRILQNYHPERRSAFVGRSIIGMCMESGCIVSSVENIGHAQTGPFTDLTDYIISGFDYYGNLMQSLFESGLDTKDEKQFNRWIHGFNALWLYVRMSNGTIEGSVHRQMPQDADAGDAKELFNTGFMNVGPDGRRNTGIADVLDQFPGVPSYLCRWPTDLQADALRRVSARRYQVKPSYGHPLLWEASMVAVTEISVTSGWGKDAVEDLLNQLTQLTSYPVNEGEGGLHTTYLAPGLAEAFLNSDAPEDCTLAEMGLPFPRMRIMLPKGLCRFNTDFGYCDAHSVYIEKRRDFLVLGGICEGPGGTKMFIENKPWENTIAGFVRRGDAIQFDFTLKKAYRELDARWNAHESDKSFSWLGLPDRPGEEEKAFWEKVWSVAAQMLLMMTMRPEWTTPEFQERKEKIKHGKVIRDALWQPNIYGAQYQIQREHGGSRDSGENSEIGKRFHWRRGHWRNQAHGEGHSLRKFIWLEPMAVGVPD